MLIAEEARLNDLIARGAILYLSHSGGKDSQAQYALLRDQIPHDQLVVVHADLGRVEWHGVQDHIRQTIDHPLHVVRSHKSFLDMVRHRARTRPDVPPWPSSATRQCTSDLKRNEIYKFIRADMKERGATIAINCMGLRAEESAARKKKPVFVQNRMLSLKERVLKTKVIPAREVYDYLPIHHLSTKQVFDVIRSAGQEPFWAYQRNKRLSCVFCIMGCDNDLAHGAEQRPELAAEYMALEEETGWTMFNGASLAERIARGQQRQEAA